MKSNRILVAIFTMMVIASLLVGCGGARMKKPAERRKSVSRFPILRQNAGRTKKY